MGEGSKDETLVKKNFGSIIAGIISVVAILVSAVQVYVVWQQSELAEAQTVERFIPHLLNSQSREIALATMNAFIKRKPLIALAYNFGSSPTLEKLSTEGSAEEKQLAQKGLIALAAQRTKLVNQMFDDIQATRIAATTALIREWSTDPAVVSEALEVVNKNIKNKSGVINTLVLFQSIDPSILKAQHDEIISFLDKVKDYGPQAKEHTGKVRALLEKKLETESVLIEPSGPR